MAVTFNVRDLSVDPEGTGAPVKVTVTNGGTGPQGPAGPQGPQGEPGEDGPAGADGAQGPAGPAGEDGASAYEVAVDEGFPGDVTAWLASLVGPQGPAGADGTDGADVEFQASATHLQWRYVGETEWNDLVPLADITGPAGPQGDAGPTGATGATGGTGPAGADGADGAPGTDGDDGREVELQKTATHIQWRYVGDASWTNLVALTDITGPQGPAGSDGADGAPGAPGADGADGADGVVQSIVAGDNVTVDDTDPANPIVSATGGGGGGGGETDWRYEPYRADTDSSTDLETLVGTWSTFTDSGQVTGGLRFNSSGVQHNSMALKIWLGPGDYELRVTYQQDGTRAIQTWEVDDGAGNYQTIGTIDAYGSSANNSKATLTFTLSDSLARRSLRVRAATKNASSSAYYIALNRIWVLRTA